MNVAASVSCHRCSWCTSGGRRQSAPVDRELDKSISRNIKRTYEGKCSGSELCSAFDDGGPLAPARDFTGEDELGKSRIGEETPPTGARRGVLSPSARLAATLRIGVRVGVAKKRGLSLPACGDCTLVGGASCMSTSSSSELGNSIGGEDMAASPIDEEEGRDKMVMTQGERVAHRRVNELQGRRLRSVFVRTAPLCNRSH